LQSDRVQDVVVLVLALHERRALALERVLEARQHVLEPSDAVAQLLVLARRDPPPLLAP
jgi:hypothetical protein